jgi:nitrogen fixation NifU-like protein
MDRRLDVHDDDHEHASHLLDERFFVHANQPQNMRPILDAQGKATGVGVCGDSIDIFLSIADQKIVQIGQIPHGCTYTVACGSAVSMLVNGKSLDDALTVTPEDVSSELGGLPIDHMHCASLAVNTLGEAIDDYYRKIWGDSAKTFQR